MKNKPKVKDSIEVKELFVLNCCGVTINTDEERKRSKSYHKDTAEYYLPHNCPVCGEKRPALIDVTETQKLSNKQ